MKFLVIEDSQSLNNVIKEILRGYEGYSDVDSAFDGEKGLELARSNNYDLVVLDLMLPKMNGRDVLRYLRETCNTPILVLTALSDIDTKVEMLDLGADDYLVKPFDRSELTARVSSILRRYNNNFGVNKYVLDDMEVDFFKKSVHIASERMDIVAKMYEVLEYLIRNKEIIISKDTLFNRIWGFDSETINSVVEVYISKLRKILNEHDMGKYLLTIKNAGYMWSERVK